MQDEILEKFDASLEGCEALLEFAKAHRPSSPFRDQASLIISGTIVRSTATFQCIVTLCRSGYGEQASMLNRTLFEDMVSAHWAARFPKRAGRLLTRHDDWARVRRAKALDKHKIIYTLSQPLPQWSGKRKKRMQRLFRSGSWTGRSIPRMVEMASPMWGAESERLHRLHDVWHQGHNALMHYSATSLSLRIHENSDGSYTFHTGPSERFVGTALGFAFWTYANTISLGVEGTALSELNALAAKYDAIVPDRNVPYDDDIAPAL